MLYLIAKIIKTLIDPANLFCLLLLLGGFAAVSRSARWQKFGRRLCLALGLILFFAGILPVGRMLVQSLENRFPPESPARVDGIILLAGDENPYITAQRHQPALGLSTPRYITFVTLAREYPHARLVYSGGSNALASPDGMTPAVAARMALNNLGVPQDRVVYEDKSHNTFENATFSAELVKPQADQNWLLVTSATHMPRSLLTFRKAGWNVFPAPAGYLTTPGPQRGLDFHVLKHLQDIHTGFYEYGGLLTYWAMGRI